MNILPSNQKRSTKHRLAYLEGIEAKVDGKPRPRDAYGVEGWEHADEREASNLLRAFRNGRDFEREMVAEQFRPTDTDLQEWMEGN